MNFESLENIKDNSVYYDYVQIDADAYLEKVRFFQHHEKQISALDFDFRIWIWVDYAISNFEIGKYHEFLKLSDILIPVIIEENIFEIDGRDIYKEMLFKKAASHYNIHEYKKSDYVFSELIKIDRNNNFYINAWKHALHKIIKEKLRYFQAISILLFILTAMIIGVELLIVNSFYAEYSSFFEHARIITFLLGVFMMIAQEAVIKIKSEQTIRNIIRIKKNKHD